MLQLTAREVRMHYFLAQATKYNFSYDAASNSANDDATVAMLSTMIFFSMVIFLLAYIFTGFTLGKIFTKANVATWKAWVPIYSTWNVLQLGNQRGIWAIASLFPVIQLVALVYIYIAMYHIGLRLGKSGNFVLIGIFAPIIWMIWLAFDKSTWQKPMKNVVVKQDKSKKQTRQSSP